MIAPQEAIRTIKSITAKEIYRLYTQIKKCGVDESGVQDILLRPWMSMGTNNKLEDMYAIRENNIIDSIVSSLSFFK